MIPKSGAVVYSLSFPLPNGKMKKRVGEGRREVARASLVIPFLVRRGREKPLARAQAPFPLS